MRKQNNLSFLRHYRLKMQQTAPKPTQHISHSSFKEKENQEKKKKTQSTYQEHEHNA
jgi:hypothetical protein